MRIEKLVRMAEQISDNIGIGSDEDVGIKVADHLRRFWDPRMLETFLKEGSQQPLSPRARVALERLQSA